MLQTDRAQAIASLGRIVTDSPARRALIQFISRLFVGQSLTSRQQAALGEIEAALGQTEHRASLH
jgi:hypothetical protein